MDRGDAEIGGGVRKAFRYHLVLFAELSQSQHHTEKEETSTQYA